MECKFEKGMKNGRGGKQEKILELKKRKKKKNKMWNICWGNDGGWE
jgi:hypothetical protein